MNQVTTIKGDIQDKDKCRLINNKYYLENRDCFFLKGKWNRINNKKIYYNLDDKLWELKKDKPKDIYFIKDYLDNKPVYGYTSNIELLYYYKGNYFLFLPKSLLIPYRPTLETIYQENDLINPDVYTKDLNNQLHSNIFKHKNNLYIDSIPVELWEELEGYSYGLEFETRGGSYLNRRELCFSTMYPVRDGSIDGIEYITDIINSNNGLSKLKYFCNISKICLSPDVKQGSLHLHIGNINFTKKQFLAFYILILKIQRDLIRFLPYYVRSVKHLSEKFYKNKKDYCKDLPNLNIFSESDEDALSSIWKFMTEGGEECKDSNYENPIHPRQGQNKWRYASRYYNVNILSYWFTEKKTIEFRLHHSTFDFREVYGWMKICKSMIDYSKNNTENCLNRNTKINLLDIINDKELTKYITSRYISYDNNCYGNKDIVKINYLNV